ncbi:MAG TPA: glucose-6-phosphate isomerase family protein [Fimbriimonadaceae bacterium]|nr:glucose-6-phosphate isomerase family protein [Fimbriimonadaceae bacterium]
MTLTDLQTGLLSGAQVLDAQKCVGDLRELWMEPAEIADPDALLYRTQTFRTGLEAEGILFWGNTTLMPGRVGAEFFMTRGHRHLRKTHGELCVTVWGQGALVLMDEDRSTRFEEMRPGSTHWIDGRFAHRTVNTGDEPLVFLCAWPADCGHDYDEVARLGFGARLLDVDGKPALVSI